MIIIRFNSYDFKISNTLNFLKGIDSILKDTEIANKIEFKDCNIRDRDIYSYDIEFDLTAKDLENKNVTLVSKLFKKYELNKLNYYKNYISFVALSGILHALKNSTSNLSPDEISLIESDIKKLNELMSSKARDSLNHIDINFLSSFSRLAFKDKKESFAEQSKDKFETANLDFFSNENFNFRLELFIRHFTTFYKLLHTLPPKFDKKRNELYYQVYPEQLFIKDILLAIEKSLKQLNLQDSEYPQLIKCVNDVIKRLQSDRDTFSTGNFDKLCLDENKRILIKDYVIYFLNAKEAEKDSVKSIGKNLIDQFSTDDKNYFHLFVMKYIKDLDRDIDKDTNFLKEGLNLQFKIVDSNDTNLNQILILTAKNIHLERTFSIAKIIADFKALQGTIKDKELINKIENVSKKLQLKLQEHVLRNIALIKTLILNDKNIIKENLKISLNIQDQELEIKELINQFADAKDLLSDEQKTECQITIDALALKEAEYIKKKFEKYSLDQDNIYFKYDSFYRVNNKPEHELIDYALIEKYSSIDTFNKQYLDNINKTLGASNDCIINDGLIVKIKLSNKVEIPIEELISDIKKMNGHEDTRNTIMQNLKQKATKHLSDLIKKDYLNDDTKVLIENDHYLIVNAGLHKENNLLKIDYLEPNSDLSKQLTEKYIDTLKSLTDNLNSFKVNEYTKDNSYISHILDMRKFDNNEISLKINLEGLNEDQKKLINQDGKLFNVNTIRETLIERKFFFKNNPEMIAKIDETIKTTTQNFINAKTQFTDDKKKKSLFESTLLNFFLEGSNWKRVVYKLPDISTIAQGNQERKTFLENTLTDMEAALSEKFKDIDSKVLGCDIFEYLLVTNDTRTKTIMRDALKYLIELNRLQNQGAKYFPNIDIEKINDLQDLNIALQILSTPKIKDFIKDKKYINLLLSSIEKNKHYEFKAKDLSYTLKYRLRPTLFSEKDLIWIFKNTQHAKADVVKKVIVGAFYDKIKTSLTEFSLKNFASNKDKDKGKKKKLESIEEIFDNLGTDEYKDAKKEFHDILSKQPLFIETSVLSDIIFFFASIPAGFLAVTLNVFLLILLIEHMDAIFIEIIFFTCLSLIIVPAMCLTYAIYENKSNKNAKLLYFDKDEILSSNYIGNDLKLGNITTAEHSNDLKLGNITTAEHTISNSNTS